MDTLEIILQSNIDKVDQQLEALVAKFSALSGAIDAVAKNKAYTDLAKDISNAYKAMSKPATTGLTKTLEQNKKSADEMIADIKDKMSTQFEAKLNFDDKSVQELNSELKAFNQQKERAEKELQRIAMTSTYDAQVKGIERWTASLVQAEKNIDVIKTKLSSLNTVDDSDFEARMSAIFDKTDTADAVKSLQAYEAEYDRLLELSKTTPDTSFESLRNEVDDIRISLRETYPEAEELNDKFLKLSDTLGVVYTEGENPIVDLSSVTKTKDEVSKLQQALSMVEPKELNTENMYVFNKQVTELENNLTKLTQKEAEMEGLGVDRESQKYITLQMRIEEVVQTLDKYKSQISKIRSEGALELKIPSLEDSGINEFEKKTTSLRDKLRDMKIIIPTDSLKEAQTQLDKLKKAYEELSAKLTEQIKLNPDYGTTEGFMKKMNELAGIREEYRKLMLQKEQLESHGGFSINTDGLSRFGEVLRKVGQDVSTIGGKISSFAGRFANMILPINKAKKAISNFSLSNVDLTKKLTKTTKMLSLMIVRMALRQVINNATTGFKNLTQYSSALNEKLSLLWNSFRQLGNAFASAVSPLIMAFAPAINYVIQLCIKAINVVNQLISALTGRKTWIKASNLTDDYAKSLDKANGSAKDLYHTTLGIDELNINRESNSGGGGDTTDPADMFSEENIPDWIFDLAGWLKSMWDKGDFFELGKYLGDVLAEALGKIPWDKIRANAKRLGRSLATLINGFIKGEFAGIQLGWWIGYTLAQAINTAFDFLNDFVRTLDWGGIGWFIADMLNGFFESIDWAPIYNSVRNGALGLAELINHFTDDFHWDDVSDSIANGLKTITDGIYYFFSRVDWDELGHKVGEQLRLTLEKIDWYSLGRAIGTVLQSAIDFITSFLDELDFKTVKEAIKKLLEGFFDSVDKAELAKLAFKGLGALLAVEIGKIGLSAVKTKLTSKLASVFSNAVTSATSSTELGSAISNFSKTLGGKIVLALGALELGSDLGSIIGKAIFPEDAEIYESYAHIDGFFRAVKDMGVGVADLISNKWGKMSKEVESTTNSVAEATIRGISRSSEAVQKLYSEYASGKVTLNEFYEGYTELIKSNDLYIQASDKTKQAIDTMLDTTGLGVFMGYINSVNDSFKELTPTINNSITSTEGYKQKLAELQTQLREGQITTSEFTQKVQELSTTYRDTSESAVGLSDNYVSEMGIMTEATDKTISDIKTKMSTEGTAIGVDFARDIAESTATALEAHGMPETIAWQVGKARAQAYKDAGGAVGSDIAGGAKEKVESDSPMIGKALDEGVAKSIDANASTVTDSASRLSEAIATVSQTSVRDAFTSGFTQLSEELNGTLMPAFFDEAIIPWFSEEKWTEILAPVQTALQTAWETFTAWWTDEAMTPWWEESVAPWLGEEKWTEQLTNVQNAFSNVWKLIREDWKKSTDDWWIQDVTPMFTEAKWTTLLAPISKAFDSEFEKAYGIVSEWMDSMKEAVSSAVAEMVASIKSIATEIESVLSGLSGEYGGGITLNIDHFATGGFPERGSLFLANEAGAEMIGTVGGKTAVASNNEITGIADAVYSTGNTQASLLATAVDLLNAISQKDASLSIDGRELVSVLDSRSTRNGFSFT